MSIVVKGAKMPNNCGACPLRLAWCTQRLYMITRPERCPLEPVRKGKWETEIRTIQGQKIPFFSYSFCGRNAADEYNFCPNCGARMSEGEE